MIRCAIVGATGYTGLELIKILLNHPNFSITKLFSSQGGEKTHEIYPALKGVFEAEIEKIDPQSIIQTCDLAFLALPHKRAMEVAKPLLEGGVKVVDLSADYRLRLENYEAFYTTHTDREHLKDAVYGLPEIFKEEIEKASLVANPGCYPTATLLGLLPFAPFIDSDVSVVVDAKSGVSGAGKKCTATSHFMGIDENHFAYNPLRHRHSVEIKEKLELVGDRLYQVLFVPHLLPIKRGMLVDCYVRLEKSIDAVEILKDFYAEESFVRVTEHPAAIANVTGTHFCDVYAQKEGKDLYISVAIDNLLRGASSQAVANANLMMGLVMETALPKVAYVP